MPTIENFGSFKICMYFADENPPHVHLVAPDFEAKMRLDDQSVFKGNAPAKAVKKAAVYVAQHHDRLLDLWHQYSGG